MAKKEKAFKPKPTLDLSKSKVFIELPNHEDVDYFKQDAPIGEVCVVYLPMICTVKPNPYFGENEGQSPKLLEISKEAPTQWQFTMQARRIVGYYLDRPENPDEAIDIYAEVEKLREIDKIQNKMATILAMQKLGIEMPSENIKSDGKEEEKTGLHKA